MNNNLFHRAGLIGLLLASSGLAGPDFIETLDAGSKADSARRVSGTGPLSGIHGELEGTALGPGDFQDMYLIFISDPAGFTASTRPEEGGNATFDTQLWLFSFIDLGSTEEARGLLANDEVPGSMPGPSMIKPQATDGTGAQIDSPALYFLAITGFDNDPHAMTAGPIYFQLQRTEISGPDGPGGSQFHESWVGRTKAGSYRINLTGAEYINCPGDVNQDGAVDPLDSGYVMARLGCKVGEGDAECDIGDVNQDGVVSPLDVGFVLAEFGDCT